MTGRGFDLHGRNFDLNAPAGKFSDRVMKTVCHSKAGVAQLVEHQPSKLRVAGSIPVSRSIVIKLSC